MPDSYDCSKCPGYCCSYDRITVSKRDVARLAKHFHIDYDTAVANKINEADVRGVEPIAHAVPWP